MGCGRFLCQVCEIHMGFCNVGGMMIAGTKLLIAFKK